MFTGIWYGVAVHRTAAVASCPAEAEERCPTHSKDNSLIVLVKHVTNPIITSNTVEQLYCAQEESGSVWKTYLL